MFPLYKFYKGDILVRLQFKVVVVEGTVSGRGRSG